MLPTFVRRFAREGLSKCYGRRRTGGSAARSEAGDVTITPPAAAEGTHLFVANLLIQTFFIFVLKWRVAGHHFVNERPQAPPVYTLAVATSAQHFRGHVLVGPANGARGIVITLHTSHDGHISNAQLSTNMSATLRQTVVREPDVTVAADQHVLGLQIPADNEHATTPKLQVRLPTDE